MRILILGGTMEARRLAERLAGRADAAALSLASRTAAPAAQPVPCGSAASGAQGSHYLWWSTSMR